MIKKSTITISLIFLIFKINAQFLAQGSIDYIKSNNAKLSMQIESDDEYKSSSHFKEVLKLMPKAITNNFKMTFNAKKSIYFFDKEGPDKMPFQWGKTPASENIVVKDFVNKTSIAQKEIYEDAYIISDSLPSFKWKIHDEIRDIAGYTCRKATTTINDSVVVVAYYTDQILVSSGPESFGGLPGMILGLAIPRLYTTWFATKISTIELADTDIKKMKKGKAVNSSKLYSDLQKRLKDWGNQGNMILWRVSL